MNFHDGQANENGTGSSNNVKINNDESWWKIRRCAEAMLIYQKASVLSR